MCALTDLCVHMHASVDPHVWKSSLIASHLSSFLLLLLFLFETRSLAISGAHWFSLIGITASTWILLLQPFQFWDYKRATDCLPGFYVSFWGLNPDFHVCPGSTLPTVSSLGPRWKQGAISRVHNIKRPTFLALDQIKRYATTISNQAVHLNQTLCTLWSILSKGKKKKCFWLWPKSENQDGRWLSGWLSWEKSEARGAVRSSGH